MKRLLLNACVGFGCMLPLMGCVVEPARPVAIVPAPYVAPPPVVVAPAPVVVGPGYYRWYHGRRVWVRRGPYWRRHRY